MELIKKLLFFVFVIFILFLFIWALFLPKTEISQTIAKAIKSQSKRSDLSFKGVVVSEISNGTKYWEIRAKTSDLNNDNNTVILKDTNGSFFEKNKAELNFISPEIVWKMDKKEIKMKQPFGFDSKSKNKVKKLLNNSRQNIFNLPDKDGAGYYFKARDLTWKQKENKISCKGNIWFRRNKIIGYAQTLKSDIKFAHVLLGGDPKIVITKPQVTTIEAMYFEFNGPKDTIMAHGDITILSGSAKAYGKVGDYDLINELVTLKGNVKLEQEKTGEIITYSVKNDRFEISGKSKAIIGGDKL